MRALVAFGVAAAAALTGQGLVACNDSLPVAPLAADGSVRVDAAADGSTVPESAAGDEGGRVNDSNVAEGASADDAAETASVQDAGSLQDGDASTVSDANDANASLCAPMNFADCSAFADLSGDAADRTITFANYQYTPKCAQVKAGQSVTFSGDFTVHPLVQACGPEDVLEHRLPLSAVGGDASFSFTLRAAGVYGYYCLDHGNPQGSLMSGAIQVIP